jgi:hypothetical protein
VFAFDKGFAQGLHGGFCPARSHQIEPTLLFHGQFYPAFLPNALAQGVFIGYGNIG